MFFLEALEEAVLKSDRRTMSILKRNWSDSMSVGSSIDSQPYKVPRCDLTIGQVDGGVKIKIEPEEYQFADQGYSGSFIKAPSVVVVQPTSSSLVTARAPILENALKIPPMKVKSKKFKRQRRTPRLTERRRPKPKAMPAKEVPAKTAAKESELPQPSDEIVEDVWHVSLENKNGHHTMKFLVKWEGFPPSENTFEPYEHVSHVEVVKEFANRKFETLEARVQAMLKNLIRDQTELIDSYNSNEKLLSEKLLRFDPLLFKCQILALLYTQENVNSQVPSTCPFMRKLRQDNVLYKFYVDRGMKKPKPSPKIKKVAEPAKKVVSDNESSAEAPLLHETKTERDLRILRRSCPIEPNPKLNGDLQYFTEDSNSTQPHVLTETEKIQFIERALGKSMATLDNPLDQVVEFEPVVRVSIKKRKRRFSKKQYRSIDVSCDHCGSSFTRKDNLETHIMTMHSENPPTYKCGTCPYETKWRRSIKAHEMTHSRPVQCKVCLLVCRNERTLYEHKCVGSINEPETFLTF